MGNKLAIKSRKEVIVTKSLSRNNLENWLVLNSFRLQEAKLCTPEFRYY